MRRRKASCAATSSCIRCCKLGFEAPRDFRLFNDQDGVLGVGRDRSLLFFSCTSEAVPGSLAEWMRNKLKPTPTDIQATEIGGAEAAIGARPRGSDTGLGQMRYVMVRHGDQVCYFNLLSEGPDRDRRIDVLVDAARTLPHAVECRGGGAPALSPARDPAGRRLRRAARPAPALWRLQDGTAARPERCRQPGRPDPPPAHQDRRTLGSSDRRARCGQWWRTPVMVQAVENMKKAARRLSRPPFS